MDILKNKKGFTLVELLAVIVILAVIIVIASSSVGGLMTEARKNALAIEGNELVNAAKNAYQLAILNGEVGSGDACFSLEYLYKKDYFSKGSDNKYKGSALVQKNADGIVKYSFWITNGSYVVAGESGATGKNGVSGDDVNVFCGADNEAALNNNNITYFKAGATTTPGA